MPVAPRSSTWSASPRCAISALRSSRRSEAERQAALFRLATLTGRTPQDLPAIAAERMTTPTLDQPIPVGDGAALLARRPDVRSMRPSSWPRQPLGSARRDRRPLSAYHAWWIGWREQRLAERSVRRRRAALAGRAADQLVAQPGCSPRPDRRQPGGQPRRACPVRRHRAARARGDRDRALHVSAGAETPAYGPQGVARRRAPKPPPAITACPPAREGQIDFLEVLDAERTFADADADLAASNGRIAAAQVDLFRSLGGGWKGAPKRPLAAVTVP